MSILHTILLPYNIGTSSLAHPLSQQTKISSLNVVTRQRATHNFVLPVRIDVYSCTWTKRLFQGIRVIGVRDRELAIEDQMGSQTGVAMGRVGGISLEHISPACRVNSTYLRAICQARSCVDVVSNVQRSNEHDGRSDLSRLSRGRAAQLPQRTNDTTSNKWW